MKRNRTFSSDITIQKENFLESNGMLTFNRSSMKFCNPTTACMRVVWFWWGVFKNT